MNHELSEALAQLIREKSLDKELVAETLEAGLLSAARKKLGPTAEIEVSVDVDAGKIEMSVSKKVTTRVNDPACEITLAEARKMNKDIKRGEVLPVQLSVVEFGRNAIQAVKQVLVQRVREAERERIYNEFQGRIGEIVRGTVQQVDRSSVIVKLERTEGILPSKEAMPRDRFRHGEYVRSCILSVDKSTKGPQVTLSRTHPDFLKGLFAGEVPEVADGTVEIKSVAREAGNRSKICVVSNDEKVDAVGACVGVKGSRVQAVVRELGGERIDIVPWSGDPVIFVTRALSPAKVIEAKPCEEEGRIEVVVADDQLSLAIGKGGQNARLAARLSGWKIDLVSLSQKEILVAEEQALRVDVENVKGITAKLAEKLLKAGVESAQDIERLGNEGLLAIPGVGAKTAEKLLTVAGDAIAEAREKFEIEKAKAAEEARAAEEAKAAEEAEVEEEEESEEEVEEEAETEAQDEEPEEEAAEEEEVTEEEEEEPEEEEEEKDEKKAVSQVSSIDTEQPDEPPADTEDDSSKAEDGEAPSESADEK